MEKFQLQSHQNAPWKYKDFIFSFGAKFKKLEKMDIAIEFLTLKIPYQQVMAFFGDMKFFEQFSAP